MSRRLTTELIFAALAAIEGQPSAILPLDLQSTYSDGRNLLYTRIVCPGSTAQEKTPDTSPQASATALEN